SRTMGRKHTGCPRPSRRPLSLRESRLLRMRADRVIVRGARTLHAKASTHARGVPAMRFARIPIFALLALFAHAASAAAQEWPARPVTLVVPYAAGGPVDTIARIVAARLSEILGQQVIVEN